MIDINFPADPSKLQFFLDRNFASTYLIARAAKHYGARNINVTFVALSTNSVKDDERNRTIHTIINKIGIANASLISSDEYTLNKTPTQVASAYKEWLSKLDPTFVPIDALIRNDVSSYVVTVGRKLGWFDADLNVCSNTDQTYVSFLNADGYITQQFLDVSKLITRPDVSEHINVWAPLQQYTDLQILQSAVEEGLIDIVKETRSCEHSRPIHCGVCGRCMERRLLMIEAGVEDDTVYEYRS